MTDCANAKAPPGWYCSREIWHDGPCAAHPLDGDLKEMTKWELMGEVARLRGLLNTPRTDEFFESVKTEAAHQIERWGTEHDAGKGAPEWFWLLSYLSGKALHFPEKRLHHIISSAAMLLNWFRQESGENNKMRPGTGHEE